MSSRIPLPEPNGNATAYKLLLKKENVVKPTSVLYRKEMLEKNKEPITSMNMIGFWDC